jgi:hypothetical protein
MAGTLHEDQYTYLIVSLSVLRVSKYFRKKIVEKIKTRI